MAYLLHIDTATAVCSVALTENDKLIGLREDAQGRNHSLMLTGFIDDLLKEHKLEPGNLDAICISAGPGSYTGLRIGVSTAKGICFACSIPLVAVGTLSAMAKGYIADKNIDREDREILLCPMIDARRMEVYSALYTASGEVFEELAAHIIDQDSFRKIGQTHRIHFFGDGAAKCSEILTGPSMVYDPDFSLSARYLSFEGYERYKSGQFEDLAYFEPAYLKDFIAGAKRDLLKKT